jgi:hypothetical protein
MGGSAERIDTRGDTLMISMREVEFALPRTSFLLAKRFSQRGGLRLGGGRVGLPPGSRLGTRSEDSGAAPRRFSVPTHERDKRTWYVPSAQGKKVGKDRQDRPSGPLYYARCRARLSIVSRLPDFLVRTKRGA